ncbi:MAG: hypothetical protein UX47_C0010G0019 [Candidatus Collierbacteria bacterium GW2011_GWA2_46_26]|uniref:Inosine/uridine-preferring nucleoside hydrolase domain-containing protein n=1 Tax=Candidatus Collierbacteria bacterium GW2011_GWA2_46_26 TaxID=1618381 RepID=A0A0G1RRB3_9BACT|nr:MAG: hypothetical protein UW29_C0010G0019 [Candidatus Collierbacteria bacterium GW2011_GWC2_44_13]KKU32503.1 MAG: hypothetical protein UX47_C0010G0019 [Candidatus Collierbacteria bacterium GW2011_GWA2_46_26]
MDDESSIVAMNALVKMELLSMAGVVANTNPERDRARVIRGLMNWLGLDTVPVAVGETVMPEPDLCPDLHLIPYIDQGGTTLREGKELILKVLTEAENLGVVIVIQTAMTDLKWLLEEHLDLVLRKVSRVVFMGGVMTELSSDGFIQPNDAMNVLFDKKAAEFCYRRLQELGVPMTITTKNATFKAMLSHNIFERMGEVGKCFAVRVPRNTQSFWRSCTAPEGSKLRGKLPMSRNRAWFVSVFCGGVNPPIADDGEIVPYLKSHAWAQYDPINLIASVPILRDRFFFTKKISVNGVEHEVIGWSPEEHGVIDPMDLTKFLEALLEMGSR